MAFDPEHHEIDPRSGFIVHKETGHPIGLMGAPPARHPDCGAEFPKWVKPHPNHLVRQNLHIAVPRFPEHHVARDGEVTVLVKDAEEEALALANPRAAVA